MPTRIFQFNDTQDTHKENFSTIFGVMGVNTETAHFFCSDFGESGAMQRTTLFLNLAREIIKDGPALPAVIVENCQGRRHGRPLTESTTVGRNRDAHSGTEQR